MQGQNRFVKIRPRFRDNQATGCFRRFCCLARRAAKEDNKIGWLLTAGCPSSDDGAMTTTGAEQSGSLDRFVPGICSSRRQETGPVIEDGQSVPVRNPFRWWMAVYGKVPEKIAY
ncbi:hypothetical protein DBV15_10495 [Temnothorax longispinosus]|uniref:Uncharacterized protein n=1 Tax=Temnothorax longispinosus TaxID=300112 RepID=A0A4S2KH16_9HYME|nr:hypothetical protein DBV15_10495 [Temnothorax longispinosus]